MPRSRAPERQLWRHTCCEPAGDLGVVILAVQPMLTLQVSGKVDIRTSVTLSCGAEYRWSNGAESRVAYCGHRYQPLQLSTDSGVDAALTGSLDARVTLDDIIGITGNIGASLHTGYHPASHPAAQLDAHASWDLGACLACFWKGTPAHVTIASGTIFNKTLWTSDTAPPPPTPPAENILIYGDNDPTDSDTTGMPNLRSALTAGGYSVETASTLPADLSSYGQIWHYGVLDIPTDDEVARLVAFTRNGGSLFLTGEWNGCCSTPSANEGVKKVFDQLVVTVGGLTYAFHPGRC